MCVCVCVRVRACVRMCVSACLCACGCGYVSTYTVCMHDAFFCTSSLPPHTQYGRMEEKLHELKRSKRGSSS